MEDVSRQTFRVNADEDRLGLHDGLAILLLADVPRTERDVEILVHLRLVEVDPELAEAGRQRDVHDLLNEPLLLPAVLDELRDRRHLETVLPREFEEIGETGHSPVFFKDLDDYSRGLEAGQPREIDRSFRVSRTH